MCQCNDFNPTVGRLEMPENTPESAGHHTRFIALPTDGSNSKKLGSRHRYMHVSHDVGPNTSFKLLSHNGTPITEEAMRLTPGLTICFDPSGKGVAGIQFFNCNGGSVWFSDFCLDSGMRRSKRFHHPRKYIGQTENPANLTMRVESPGGILNRIVFTINQASANAVSISLGIATADNTYDDVPWDTIASGITSAIWVPETVESYIPYGDSVLIEYTTAASDIVTAYVYFDQGAEPWNAGGFTAGVNV